MYVCIRTCNLKANCR